VKPSRRARPIEPGVSTADLMGALSEAEDKPSKRPARKRRTKTSERSASPTTSTNTDR
jgi:hypothetical protein